jgi:hypothetical protein
LLTTDAYRTGAYPISARPAGFPRNAALMPRTISLDARVMKTIKVKHDRALLQFGVEAFNLYGATGILATLTTAGLDAPRQRRPILNDKTGIILEKTPLTSSANEHRLPLL